MSITVVRCGVLISHDAAVVVVGDGGAQTAIAYTKGIIMFRGPSGSVEISSPTYSQVNQWFHTSIVRETGSDIKLYVYVTLHTVLQLGL